MPKQQQIVVNTNNRTTDNRGLPTNTNTQLANDGNNPLAPPPPRPQQPPLDASRYMSVLNSRY